MSESTSLCAFLRRHGWYGLSLFPLPFGYVYNGGWYGFKNRSKDGDVWFIQIWHPTKKNLLLFSQRPWIVVA